MRHIASERTPGGAGGEPTAPVRDTCPARRRPARPRLSPPLDTDAPSWVASGLEGVTCIGPTENFVTMMDRP